MTSWPQYGPDKTLLQLNGTNTTTIPNTYRRLSPSVDEPSSIDVGYSRRIRITSLNMYHCLHFSSLNVVPSESIGIGVLVSEPEHRCLFVVATSSPTAQLRLLQLLCSMRIRPCIAPSGVNVVGTQDLFLLSMHFVGSKGGSPSCSHEPRAHTAEMIGLRVQSDKG